MAITTLDQVIAGMKPSVPVFKGNVAFFTGGQRMWSSWGSPGIPCAGNFDTTLNGVALTNPTDGQITFVNPTGGNSAYFASSVLTNAHGNGFILLCDRLWHNGGYNVTSTGAQSSTTPTWPSRDADGTTSGRGVFLGVEVSTTLGNANPSYTISYTNSGGTSGRSGSKFSGATIATGAPPLFFPITLQAGDVGVQSVQSLTLGTSQVSGVFNLVAYRIIGCISIDSICVAIPVDAISGGGMSQMFSGSVPFFIFVDSSGATNNSLVGSVTFTEG